MESNNDAAAPAAAAPAINWSDAKQISKATTEILKAERAICEARIEKYIKAGFDPNESVASKTIKLIDEALSKRVDDVLSGQLNEALSHFTHGKKLDAAKLAEALTAEGKHVTMTFNPETGKLSVQVIVKHKASTGGGGGGGVKSENPFKGKVSLNGKPAPATWKGIYDETEAHLVANGVPARKLPTNAQGQINVSMFLEFKKLVKANPSVEALLTVEGGTMADVYTWKGNA